MTGGHKTNFEADLEKKSLLLNERQRRILNDLKILRVLLSKVPINQLYCTNFYISCLLEEFLVYNQTDGCPFLLQ